MESLAQFGRLISASKPPQRQAKEKAIEALAAYARYTALLNVWNRLPLVPQFHDVVGEKLIILAGEDFREWYEKWKEETP